MTAFNESKFSRSAHTIERKAQENSMAKRVVPQSQNPRTNTKSPLHMLSVINKTITHKSFLLVISKGHTVHDVPI